VRLLSYIGVFLLFVRASVGQTAGTPPIVSGNVGTSSSQAITSEGRLKWFIASTVGPPSLVAGTISAGWGTLLNSPHEYGPH
jgi:hypothetical protein